MALLAAMKRLLPLMLIAAFALAPTACDKAETTTPEDATAHHEGEEEDHHDEAAFEGREVVGAWQAQAGDVTLCPVSGEKFEVSEASDRFEYQGHSFAFCCGGCLEKAKADPAQYLDALVEEAGGPATAADPEPAEGGAVDDSAS